MSYPCLMVETVNFNKSICCIVSPCSYVFMYSFIFTHLAAYDNSSFGQYYLNNLDSDIFDLVK